MAAEKVQFKNDLNAEQNKKFNQGIIVSFAVHAIIASIFILQVVFLSQSPIDISQAIRVDMVGLPDKLKPNEMPAKVEQILKEKPAPEEKVAEATKPVEEKKLLPKKEIKTDTESVNLKKTKQKQKLAVEKLKAQSAIEKMRQETLDEERLKKKTAAAAAPVKGRVISAGSTLSGLDKLQNDNYLLTLDAHVKQFWVLPQWLRNKPYKARVLVKFDSGGRILSSQIVQSSGQSSYDEYCLQAIEQASPFPKFTEKFSEKYRKDGVVFGFPE